MDAPTDEQLIAEYLRGEAASFDILVHRHAGELYRFAFRFTVCSTAAEDVVQETFLQVSTSANQFDVGRRFKPWLFTIAANKARDYLRRRDRKREISFDVHIGGEEECQQRYVDLLAGEAPNPGELESRERQHEVVRLAIEVLPDRLREVLVLAYYHRAPYREIAEILGIPLGTVKSRLHAAVGAFTASYEAVLSERETSEQ